MLIRRNRLISSRTTCSPKIRHAVGNANAVSSTYLYNVFSVCSAVECNRLNCVPRVWLYRESLSLRILPLPPTNCSTSETSAAVKAVSQPSYL
jgi:hypothetical protein